MKIVQRGFLQIAGQSQALYAFKGVRHHSIAFGWGAFYSSFTGRVKSCGRFSVISMWHI